MDSVDKTIVNVKSLPDTLFKDKQLVISVLIELRDMIGNDKTKENLAKHINYLVSMKKKGEMRKVMLHTVIYGSPGVGKTLLACKLGAIWSGLGYLKEAEKKNITDELNFQDNPKAIEGLITIFFIIGIFSLLWAPLVKVASFFPIWIVLLTIGLFSLILIGWYIMTNYVKPQNHINKKSNNNSSAPQYTDIVTVVSRDSFVDIYLGGTDVKTKKLLDNNQGKVIFVDEAYSLCNGMYDPYGMEALTTLNLYMSEHPDSCAIIFAGYKKNLELTVFKAQPGLVRRFLNHIEIVDYNAAELFAIFEGQVKAEKYKLSDPELVKELFENNYKAFVSFGGDCERLLTYTLTENCSDDKNDNIITVNQVERGINLLWGNNIQRKDTDKDSTKADTIISSKLTSTQIEEILSTFGSQLAY